MVWPFKSKASEEDLEKLREKVLSHDQDLDELLSLYQDLESKISENREDLETVEEETERLSQVIESVQEEIGSEDEIVELKGMEQDIFRILAQSDQALTNSEIGEKMDPERDGNQVRPKVNSLKEKITVLESKKGRAKAYRLPQPAREKIEQGKTLDSIQELKK